MNSYERILDFVKKVRPYISKIEACAADVEHGGNLTIEIYFIPGAYEACKVFEPWEPTLGYYKPKWEIPVSEVIKMRPVNEEDAFKWSMWLGRIREELQAD
jgi:hypothetical protein